jgi:hypothetical protein
MKTFIQLDLYNKISAPGDVIETKKPDLSKVVKLPFQPDTPDFLSTLQKLKPVKQSEYPDREPK